jgi:hypothetical protein
MSGKRRITKIKEHDGKIIIHYQVIKADERIDEFTLSCTDAPRPEFQQAMQALTPTLAQWCDIPPAWCESLTVIGVSISWTKDIMGACVTAKRPCSSSAPLILNAPHKPAMPYSEGGDDSVCLTMEQIEAVQAVIDEAEVYVDGDRAQMELQLGDSIDAVVDADEAPADGPSVTLSVAKDGKQCASVKFRDVKHMENTANLSLKIMESRESLRRLMGDTYEMKIAPVMAEIEKRKIRDGLGTLQALYSLIEEDPDNGPRAVAMCAAACEIIESEKIGEAKAANA